MEFKLLRSDFEAQITQNLSNEPLNQTPVAYDWD